MMSCFGAFSNNLGLAGTTLFDLSFGDLLLIDVLVTAWMRLFSETSKPSVSEGMSLS